MKHSREPWRIADPFTIESEDGYDLVSIPDCSADEGGRTTEDRANAKRIIACVNAMAGVENPTQFMADARAIAIGTKKPAAEMAKILNRFQVALLEAK